MSSFNQSYEQTECFGGVCSGCTDSDNSEPNICSCSGVSCTNGDSYQSSSSDCTNPTGVCAAVNDSINGSYPVGCPNGKWQCSNYDYPGGINSAWLCSDPDPGQCPEICDNNGDNCIKATSASFDMASGDVCQVNVPDPEIVCIYNNSDFDIVDYATSWQTVSWGDYQSQADDNYVNDVAPSICGRTASSVGVDLDGNPYTDYCPIDTVTGLKMTDCSRMVLQNDPFGYSDICGNWCNENTDACETTINTYCLSNNTPDCSCVNRGSNQTYEALVGKTPLSDVNEACWWFPCSGTNLIPFLIPKDIADNPCTTDLNICAEVTAAIDTINTNINIGTSSGVISCGQGADDTGGGGDERNFNTGLTLLLIGGAVIIVIIVILLFIIF